MKFINVAKDFSKHRLGDFRRMVLTMVKNSARTILSLRFVVAILNKW